MQGRIYSGRQALERKLVDEIGGETEAVKWLETQRGVTKDLKVVSWKPAPESPWSQVTGSAGSAAGAFARSIVNGMVEGIALAPSVGRLGLDGLVSVWQPQEN